MAFFASHFFPLLTLFLVHFTCNYECADHTCPSQEYCMGSTSSISNLLCYSYRHNTGLDYAIIGFANRLAVVCTVYYNCQPGKEADMRIIEVVGFLLRLEFRYLLANGSYEYGSNLWYVDNTIPSCRSFYKVRLDPYLGPAGFSPGIQPIPLSSALVYAIYRQMYETVKCQCNIFSDTSSKDCSKDCPGALYFAREPLKTIGLQDTTCAVAYYYTNTSVVEAYVADFEIPGVTVTKLNTTLPSSEPVLYRETATATGYDNYPHCKDFRHTLSISDLLTTYDYYVNCLDKYTFSKVLTLYAQGPNPNNSSSSLNCTRYYDRIASFCSINFIPDLASQINYGTPNQEVDGIVYWQLNGYITDSAKQTILNNLF